MAWCRTAWRVLPLAAVTLLGGCTERSTEPYPANRPPSTYLSIQSSVPDTLGNQEAVLGYRHILSWTGVDPDGFVAGFLLRWEGGAEAWQPEPGDSAVTFEGSTWTFTTVTEDTFVVRMDAAPGVPNQTTEAVRRFRVRAVDNRGLVDPAGRVQAFRLRNWVPRISWAGALTLPSRSLPAVSFAWTTEDLDGRETVDRFEYWLDGADSTEVLATPDTVTALRPEDFEVDGAPVYGTRTLFVRAVDETGTWSNTIAHTWTVEEPQGRFLLIDDASSSVPGSSREDGFFRAMLDSIAPADYFVYSVEERGRFRTANEVEPLFSLFEGVVWYSGVSHAQNDPEVFRNLSMAEPGLRAYLENGGRVLLAATNAVGDSAGLSPAFAEEVLGIDGYYRTEAGSHDAGLATRGAVYYAAGAPSDSLQTTTASVNADFPILAADTQAPFLADRRSLSEAVLPEDSQHVPASVLSERFGRIAVLPFLLSRADGYGNRNAIGAAFFRSVLAD